MKFIDKQTLQLDKVLTELDLFVLNFLRILEKHVQYVIVSGYISILFGRARATEDIDLFIQKIDKQQWAILYHNLITYGYWCLNTENSSEAYDYLKDGLALRFAREKEVIPNFELKFALTPLAKESFHDTLTVKTSQGNFRISSLERQIAFKRYYLKSEKDLEDARHIEQIFKDQIDIKKVEAYKKRIDHETS